LSAYGIEGTIAGKVHSINSHRGHDSGQGTFY
jgi:hypothetical protein